ncbi:L-threonylcarbamoyladenylate synthase [bacterium]|nr:L-threonylcarbamoyladenylate synthase [bacterium]
MMDTRIVQIDPKHVVTESIEKIIETLQGGGIIGYPTETVYGLGGDAMNEQVVEQIYQLKGREVRYPFPLFIDQREDVYLLTRSISPRAETLMTRFWPGPLTLVFDASPSLPQVLTGKECKVGLRISSDPICRAILKRYHKLLISTSANLSGEKPAQSASQVLKYFRDQVNLIVDGGERRSGVPSTVVDVSGTCLRIIREGMITKDEIEKVIGFINESENN